MTDDIERIRHFNRFYTRRMGIMSNNFAGSGYSVTDLRVLYDIATGAAKSATQIAKSLELDKGYVSRILKGYEQKGWVRRQPSAQDARRKDLVLADAGRKAFAELTDVTRQETQTRLGKVDANEIADAMQALEARFGGLSADDVTLRDLQPGDLGWVIQQNARYYEKIYGFNAQFEALLLDIFADFLKNFDPKRECGLIANAGPTPLGSIFCCQGGTPDLAKLRVFYVEPWAQGLGIGQRLMDECLSFARKTGYSRMNLMTHQSQAVARNIYEKYGFQKISSEAGIKFGEPAIEEHWELAL